MIGYRRRRLPLGLRSRYVHPITDYGLDFIGQTLFAMPAEMREFRNDVDARFDKVEARLAALESRDQKRLTKNPC